MVWDDVEVAVHLDVKPTQERLRRCARRALHRGSARLIHSDKCRQYGGSNVNPAPSPLALPNGLKRSAQPPPSPSFGKKVKNPPNKTTTNQNNDKSEIAWSDRLVAAPATSSDKHFPTVHIDRIYPLASIEGSAPSSALRGLGAVGEE